VCSAIGCSLSDVLRTMADLAGYEIVAKVDPGLVPVSEAKRWGRTRNSCVPLARCRQFRWLRL